VESDAWEDVDVTVHVTVIECRWRDSGLCDYRKVDEQRIPGT